jgi:hypothetical protein
MAVPTEHAPGKVLPSPEVLRRNVVEQLSRLPDEGVLVLHELAQELELRAAWEEFSEGMARDWADGNYERLDEALTKARAAIRASQLE